jgi:hypothetical protein
VDLGDVLSGRVPLQHRTRTDEPNPITDAELLAMLDGTAPAPDVIEYVDARTGQTVSISWEGYTAAVRALLDGGVTDAELQAIRDGLQDWS